MTTHHPTTGDDRGDDVAEQEIDVAGLPEALGDEVERARTALNSTRWWQFIKRQEAADRYKRALLRGALWEINHSVTPPAMGGTQ